MIRHCVDIGSVDRKTHSFIGCRKGVIIGDPAMGVSLDTPSDYTMTPSQKYLPLALPTADSPFLAMIQKVTDLSMVSHQPLVLLHTVSEELRCRCSPSWRSRKSSFRLWSYDLLCIVVLGVSGLIAALSFGVGSLYATRVSPYIIVHYFMTVTTTTTFPTSWPSMPLVERLVSQ